MLCGKTAEAYSLLFVKFQFAMKRKKTVRTGRVTLRDHVPNLKPHALVRRGKPSLYSLAKVVMTCFETAPCHHWEDSPLMRTLVLIVTPLPFMDFTSQKNRPWLS